MPPSVSNSPAESMGFAVTLDLLDIFVLVPLLLWCSEIPDRKLCRASFFGIGRFEHYVEFL
jgi:hypothetical protein